MLRRPYDAAKRAARARWFRFLQKRPHDLIGALRAYHGPETTNLAAVDPDVLPSQVTGFHDLAYLFACHNATRGIIAQDLDEAAYLWRVIVDNRPENVLEIGRWLGGSTVLLCAAAAQYGGRLISVDSKVWAPEYASDELLDAHLKRLGLANYELCVAASETFDPGRVIQLALIDGDHSYRGVKQDFENVVQYLSPEADLLFHDSCMAREFASQHEGVAQLMAELRSSPVLQQVRQVGSITHLRMHRG